MATAREVRAAVRAQLAEQMAGRQKAALSVASAYAKVEKARERLAAAEQEAGAALTVATDTVPLGELVTLAGVPASELRRLTRGRQDAPADAPGTDLVELATDTLPAPTGPAPSLVAKPVAAAS